MLGIPKGAGAPVLSKQSSYQSQQHQLINSSLPLENNQGII
jgi:hypothetical protein